MNILLADDTMDTLLMYSLAFTVAGHKVHLAHDGQDAFAAAQIQCFDVVVLDIGMPRMSGWEVTAAIRRLSAGSDVPIVLFTAFYSPDHERRALQIGANRIVKKPIMPDDLLGILTCLVEEHKR